MSKKNEQNQLLNIDKFLKAGKIEQAIKIIITLFTTKSALRNKLIREKSALDARPTA